MIFSKRERLAIIGSGGKTTLMKRLAEASEGRVLMTTTTHIASPAHGAYGVSDGCDYPGIFIPFVNKDDLIARWDSNQRIVLSARIVDGRRGLCGLSSIEVDELSQIPWIDTIIVEADGSKRLPIKAHASYEPVLFSRCTRGIAVMGMSAVGRKIEEGAVHRPELLRELLHVQNGHILSVKDVATALLAYLRLFGPNIPRDVVLSQCESSSVDNINHLNEELARLLDEERAIWTNGVRVFCQTLSEE